MATWEMQAAQRAAELEAAKSAAGASGWLSPREFSMVAGIGEGTTRTAIRERTVEHIRVWVSGQERVFISPAEVLKRHLPGLMTPATRTATIARLRDNAKVARVEFDFDGLERNIELMLNAMSAQPSESMWASIPAVATPERERELVEVGADRHRGLRLGGKSPFGYGVTSAGPREQEDPACGI